MRLLWILGILLSSSLVNAQFLHPEYQTLTEERVKNFYDASDVTMEYESDFFHFFPSHKLLNSYYQSKNSFLGSVGSLGKKNFMIRQAAKFRSELSDRVDFGFIQFGEEDFESQHRGIIFEFLFWNPDHNRSIVLFGEASYLKGEDDIGLAYERQKSNEKYRLFAIASDFSRNERGVGTDEFVNSPLLIGFYWERHPSQYEFTRLNASWQFQTVWDFPDDSERYRYRQGQLQFLSRKELSLSRYYNSMIYYEGIVQQQVSFFVKERRVLRISQSIEKQRSELGMWFANHYFTINDSKLKYNFFQPFLWFSQKGPEADSRWRLGLSAVVGDRDDGNTGFLPEDSGDEYRLNLAWESKPVEVLFSLDMDRIGESDMWEGGNVKVQTDF